MLVEEQDPGRAWRDVGSCPGDDRGEPGGGCLDAFERVAAVDVPGDVLFAARVAPARPADVLKAVEEFPRKGGLWDWRMAEGR